MWSRAVGCAVMAAALTVAGVGCDGDKTPDSGQTPAASKGADKAAKADGEAKGEGGAGEASKAGTDKAAPQAPLDDEAKALVVVMQYEHGRTLGTTEVGPVALATHELPTVRARAALAIGRIGDPGGLDALKTLLTDDVDAVRAEAAFAMALIAADGDDKTKAAVRERLLEGWKLNADAAPEVRRMLVWGLRKVGGKDAEGLAGVLAEASRDADISVRAEALYTFAMLVRFNPDTPGVKDNKTLIGVARSKAGDTGPELRRPALYALMRLADPKHAAEMKQAAGRVSFTEAERAMAIRALTSMKVFDVPLMRGILLPPPDSTEENPEPEDLRGDAMTQVAAVRHLAAAGDKDAIVLASALLDDLVNPMVEHGKDLSSPRFHVLMTLVESLPKFADKARAKTLLEKAHKAATEGKALRRPDNAFGQQLNAALLDCAASTALDHMDGELGRVLKCGVGLEKAFSAEQRQIAVVGALAGLKDKPVKERVGALVARYVESKRRVKVAIVGAAASMVPPKDAPDEEATAALLKLAKLVLQEHDPVLVAYGAGMVADLGDKESAVKLRAILKAMDASKDPGKNLDKVLEPMAALVKLQDADAASVIAPWTTNPVAVVRRRAVEALSKLDPEGKVKFEAFKAAPAEAKPSWARAEPVKVTMRTTRGNIELELRPDLAPATVASFTKLASEGYFNGLNFHRVIAGFVSQGGDPRGDGSGGPGYTLPAEWNAQPYEAGVLGMAHAAKDTGGSQFFFTHVAHPHLDGGYTVFGKATKGLDVIQTLQQGDRIAGVDVAK